MIRAAHESASIDIDAMIARKIYKKAILAVQTCAVTIHAIEAQESSAKGQQGDAAAIRQ